MIVMSEEEEVKKILEEAKSQIKLEHRAAIFEDSRKLRADDLKISQDPEEFTKRHIIEKVFRVLGVKHETGEVRFTVTGGRTRKADYAASKDRIRFLVEAKPIGSTLKENTTQGAVNQVKDLFRLAEAKEKYGFGVATDGLNWIIINPRREIIAELSLEKDFGRIRDFLIGKREAKKERRQEEISKRFFEWYNSLLHGGSFKDLKGKQRKITPQDSLVNNIQNVSSAEDREEIAQIIVDRLIFIKFIQAKGLIKSDILEYLASIRQDALKWTLDQLFFSVLNTEKNKRPKVDPKFNDVPYLNGSLFTRTKPEERNQYYNVKAEILQKVIEFLDSFRFASELEEVEEALDPEILGYIFERAMTATDRKGTGAYYTPKYITRYISENTIYPFILDRANKFLLGKGYRETELLNSIDELFTKVSETTIQDIRWEIVEKIRVLDPACGSGAFLLAAANVLLELQRRFVQRLGLRISDLSLKKLILEKNIFGVDLNHKGIEIAKLRLWLWLAQSYDPEGKIEPLPNIEYNLRPGNSLVGFVDVSVFKEIRVSMDDFLAPEESLVELMNRRDPLIDEYKSASGERARELRGDIEGLNNKIKIRLDAQLFNELKTKVGITPEEFAKLDVFHWGFEFHDIFSNGKDGNGFDVVIGNPPYVRQEALGDFKKILKEYYEVYHGVADLYTYFFERGHKILNQNGQFGFISSNKFMRSNYGKNLRDFLTEDYHINQIIDFGELPVFQDAATFPAVVLTEKAESKGRTTLYAPIKSLDFEDLGDAVLSEGNEIPESAFSGFTWSLGGEAVNQILKKMADVGTPMGEYTEGQIRFGVKTGFNKAFIIDKETREKLIKKDQKSAEIIKPLIVGDDVRKYEINFKDKYLIFTKQEIDIEKYPVVRNYLEQFRTQLTPKKDRHEKIGRKPGKYKWYEIQDTVDYYSDFEKPKIVYPDIGITPRFSLDTENYFPEATCFEIPVKDTYLLCLLNSSLLFFYIKSLTPVLGDANKRGRIRFKTVYLKRLPVSTISFITPQDERNRLASELKDLYEKGEFNKILELVETYLPQDSEGNFIKEQEKSDVVHELLAFLAEQMIEMNKEKQSEIKGFLGWLEDYIKINVDDMTLKSKAKEYYKHNLDEMKKILVRNKIKITEFDITRREPLEKIKQEFESSKSKLNPLLDRIKDTDNLIDQIVYKLYGLTPEEIRVVEGNV